MQCRLIIKDTYVTLRHQSATSGLSTCPYAVTNIPISYVTHSASVPWPPPVPKPLCSRDSCYMTASCRNLTQGGASCHTIKERTSNHPVIVSPLNQRSRHNTSTEQLAVKKAPLRQQNTGGMHVSWLRYSCSLSRTKKVQHQ